MVRLFEDASNALSDLLCDNMTIMAGGFGLCGIPEKAISAIAASKVKDLTIISNNCGVDDKGLGILLKQKQIKKMISSYVGENRLFAEQLLSKELDVELVPQGTLAERIRAGGAGIPAFYTKTGVGTVVADGKEQRIFEGETYILEQALHADLAIVKGDVADTAGNVQYRHTAANFNPLMVTAATDTLVEVEQLVEIGAIDPNLVHTPSIFVKRLVVGTGYQKSIEQRTTRNKSVEV